MRRFMGLLSEVWLLSLLVACGGGGGGDSGSSDQSDDLVTAVHVPSVLSSVMLEGPEIDDWVGQASALERKAFPADGAVSIQTYPDFAWPLREGATGYRVRVRGTSVDQTVSSQNGFLSWPSALAPGQYQWQVAYEVGDAVTWSKARGFTVASDANTFRLSSLSASRLVSKIEQRARPRTLPIGSAKQTWVALLNRDYGRGLADLYYNVDAGIRLPVSSEPTDASQVHRRVYAETVRFQRAAFAWYITGRADYLSEAKRRALNMASWSTTGLTGFQREDPDSRSVGAMLATAYDWLYDQWTPTERVKIYKAAAARLTPLYNYLFDNDRLLQYPYDSTGDMSITVLAGSLVALVGDYPAHRSQLVTCLNYLMSTPTIWGTEDGGFANGSNYAMLHTSAGLSYWDAIEEASGLNLYGKAWFANNPLFFIYFMPPGSPNAPFGDGSEAGNVTELSILADALFRRQKTDATGWYASAQPGQHNSEVLLLMRAIPSPEKTWEIPTSLPNAVIFPLLGQTAMHSCLSDSRRISVYFRSSSFGSYSHSHADQNSFVINGLGRPLAIDSGYYDSYGSAHWDQWYRQTIAHNAITFDGRQGQTVGSREATGRIVHFSHDNNLGDSVSGDAVKAYGGKLTRAMRSLAYLRNDPALRQDTIVVYDSLASQTPRSWEWNIHAANQMTVGDNRFEIASGSVALCVTKIAGPDSTQSQTNAFPVSPTVTKAAQWHGQFKAIERSRSADYIVVMQVGGCSKMPTVTSRQIDDGWLVTVGQRTVRFSQTGKTTIQ